jgi:hypothetical protein
MAVMSVVPSPVTPAAVVRKVAATAPEVMAVGRVRTATETPAAVTPAAHISSGPAAEARTAAATEMAAATAAATKMCAAATATAASPSTDWPGKADRTTGRQDQGRTQRYQNLLHLDLSLVIRRNSPQRADPLWTLNLPVVYEVPALSPVTH